MITVIQYNCVRSYEWIILGQTEVDSTVDILCLQNPQRGRGGVGISPLPCEETNRKRVLIMIRKCSGLVVGERTESSQEGNDNVLITDLRRSGEKITTIVSIYDQRETKPEWRPGRKLNGQRVTPETMTIRDA
jgi:hypothetical protein